VRAADPADTLIDATTVGRVHMPLVIGPPLRITHHEQGHFWSWWVAGIPATGHRIDALPKAVASPSKHDDGVRLPGRVPASARPHRGTDRPSDAMTAHPSVLVVGAGLSGVLAARGVAATAEVTVVEKSRGVGGRLATRRLGPATFDHGAQFFTAQSPVFTSLVTEWLGPAWPLRGSASGSSPMARRWTTATSATGVHRA